MPISCWAKLHFPKNLCLKTSADYKGNGKNQLAAN